MSRVNSNFVRALCLAMLMIFTSVVCPGCHKEAGEGGVASDINISMGGGSIEQGQAAAAPTVAVKLVRLDGTEMDLSATPVPLSAEIKLVFSEAMKTQSVEGALSLLDPKSNKVDGKPGWSADKMTLTFKPNAKLLPKTKYALKVSADAVSEAGTAIAPIDQTFTTMTPGDVNGDGVPDFVVGAQSFDNKKGAAYVISSDAQSGQYIATISGLANNAIFGNTVAIVGDLDGDGYADVVVGARQETVNLAGVGAVYAFSGKRLQGNIDTSKADAAIVGEGKAVIEYFGAAVAGIGDIDGDGYDDLLIGASQFANGQGKAYLFSGKNLLNGNVNKIPANTIAKSTISGKANDLFGRSLAPAGDIDKNGIPDIIIGAPGGDGDPGKVYVFSGSVLNGDIDTSKALVAIPGDANSKSRLGIAVAGIGDFDGDGIDYVLVGAFEMTVNNKEVGAAYLLKGGAGFENRKLSEGIRIDGNPTEDIKFGFSVAGIGDNDGDGKPDFVVGSFGTNTDQGRVYLYTKTQFPLPFKVYNGAAKGDKFGHSVSGIGDMKSSKGNFVVGASGPTANSVYLYDGSNTVTHKGVNATDEFGTSVSGNVK